MCVCMYFSVAHHITTTVTYYSHRGFLDKYSWWRVESSFWSFNGKTLQLLCFADPSQKVCVCFDGVCWFI
jgi:hypothetical protein